MALSGLMGVILLTSPAMAKINVNKEKKLEQITGRETMANF
jgi:hypothetical protein